MILTLTLNPSLDRTIEIARWSVVRSSGRRRRVSIRAARA